MDLLNTAIQRFVELCEIPDLYSAIENELVTIKVNINRQRKQEIEIDCCNISTAKKIFSHYVILTVVMRLLNFAECKITVKSTLFRVLSSNSNRLENHLFLKKMNGLQEIADRLNVDLDGLHDLPQPTYIIMMRTETLMLANKAAFLAQQKNANELLGADMNALNYPDELERRKQLLRLDGSIRNYEFKAMHWYKDGAIWRRKEMEIVTDLLLVDLFGARCRIGIELNLEETKRFVD